MQRVTIINFGLYVCQKFFQALLSQNHPHFFLKEHLINWSCLAAFLVLTKQSTFWTAFMSCKHKRHLFTNYQNRLGNISKIHNAISSTIEQQALTVMTIFISWGDKQSGGYSNFILHLDNYRYFPSV